MKAGLGGIGIDLGTRNARCAYVGKENNAIPVMVPNRWGAAATPSAAGRDALTPLIRSLREDAEVFLGRIVSSCALAMPERFTPLQREIMTQAAEAAGITRIGMISEPAATALAFGGEGRFLIADFGADAADMSVVEGEGGAYRILESAVNSDVSGRGFDLALAEWLLERLQLDRMSNEDPRWRVLIMEAETIKIALSSYLFCDWKPPSQDGREFKSFRIERDELERLTRFSIKRLLHALSRLWDKHRPKGLLLTGGSSRVPLLRESIEREIARPEPLSFEAEESVAFGAALYAAGQERSSSKPTDPSITGRARDLKTRLAPIEPSLTDSQRERLRLLLAKLENDAGSIEILEGMIKDLEAEFAKE
jgi:molecular chaperone DnaK (HSP70)